MRTIRLAFRTLFHTPFVTTVAIVSLAFGIGANSAIFSLFDQMLLRPLPVAKPNELVDLSSPGPKPGSQSCGLAGDCDDVFSYAMFRDLEHDNGGAFSGVAAHQAFGTNLSYDGETIDTSGTFVSGSYFRVLGLQPALGRLLDSNDDRQPDDAPVVVLGHTYWQSHLGASPKVLNQTMLVNGVSMTIVGVAPRGFDSTTLGLRADVFVPITMRGRMLHAKNDFFDSRTTYWAYLFARLAPGKTVEAARAAADARYHAVINAVEVPLQHMSAATLEKFKTKTLGVTRNPRGQSSLHEEARTPLAMLFAVTGTVLLIACANIANLLLARSAARAGEMAVRLSIGAGRGQLISQLLTESVVLALMGGLAGMIVAKATLQFIMSLLPSDAVKGLTFTLEPSILLFAAALSILTGVLFGLVPAIYTTRPDLASTLKGTAGRQTGSAAGWFRTSLVVSQIALSTALLIAAGLFAKSLMNVANVDIGVKVNDVITFGISPRRNGYTPEKAMQLFRQTEEQLAAVPGVTGVTASLVPLLANSNWGTGVNVQGFPIGPDVDNNSRFNEIGPGYFRVLSVPLISGREFTASDVSGARKVAIVNETFAEKFKLGHDVVGKLIAPNDGKVLDTEIIGFVKNATYSQVKGVIPPLFFTPYRQDDDPGTMSFYVRTALDSGAAIAAIRGVMTGLDRTLPLEDFRTMPDQIKQNIFLDRMISTLSVAFAILATVLASIGLYGVLAYTVSQRTREFGLRMALGAQPSSVWLLVIRQVALMTVVGAAIGGSVAWYFGRAAQSLLYKMESRDARVFAVSIAALALVAFLAGLIPAIRASRINPMRALRYE